jgi:hypothetical protein
LFCICANSRFPEANSALNTFSRLSSACLNLGLPPLVHGYFGDTADFKQLRDQLAGDFPLNDKG